MTPRSPVGPTGVQTPSAGPTAASVLRRARDVATIAAAHADEHDAAATFPSEAMVAARSAKLLAASIPVDLGGYGLTLGEVASLCSALAAGCGSTGMIFAMHQIQVAALAHHSRGPWRDEILRQIATSQLLVASSTTEGAAGGDLSRSQCAIVVENTTFSLRKEASTMSYGAYCDALLVTARRGSESSETDQVLLLLRRPAFSLELRQEWQALGMRGTCSASFDLAGTGPLADILDDPFHTIQAATMEPVAHVLWSAVWAGIAAGALERARRHLRRCGASTGGRPPFGAERLAQGLAALSLVRDSVLAAAREFDDHRPPSGETLIGAGRTATMLKINASELSLFATLRALEACGIAGYRTIGEYSIGRHLRDICSAPIMINNSRLYAALERTALLTEISPWLA
jgi:acyl-CoA dehydrogenase